MTRQLDAAGRARLRQRFAALPERMKAAAKLVIEAEADALVDEMRRAVSVDDGDLRASIRQVEVERDGGIAHRVSAGGVKTTKRIRKSAKGSSPTYDYAMAVEHGYMSENGTHVAADPFFYPTTRRRRRRYRARLARALKKAASADS